MKWRQLGKISKELWPRQCKCLDLGLRYTTAPEGSAAWDLDGETVALSVLVLLLPIRVSLPGKVAVMPAFYYTPESWGLTL